MSDPSKKSCFVIMPFSVREHDLGRYGDDKNHWSEVYQGLIVPAVEAAGLKCERDDEDVSSRLIAEHIWRKLENADVVLCDLSAHNPNVYLELGWALRADKRFVLIKDDVTTFSFDLNQFHTFEYSHRLQPLAVRQSVKNLSTVIDATLADTEKRYSMVARMSLQAAAERASKGNLEMDVLSEILHQVTQPRFTAAPDRSHAVWRTRATLGPIKNNTDLTSALIGTTWRKSNDVEHLIFDRNGKVWNNHAGHPKWRENKFRLSEQLRKMTITWTIDDLEGPCVFSPDFSEFVENNNTTEGTWRLLATEPHTPAWGV